MIEVWTDGSCRFNPGPGGYAALLVDGDIRTEVVGSHPATTNNRMELTAAIRGIEAADVSIPLTVFSDSTYVLHGGARYAVPLRKPHTVCNGDLWWEMLRAVARRSAPITWTKVKAHAGIPNNEFVDSLAFKAACAA